MTHQIPGSARFTEAKRSACRASFPHMNAARQVALFRPVWLSVCARRLPSARRVDPPSCRSNLRSTGRERPASARQRDPAASAGTVLAAASECREMIREAHAATKDLRAAVREAKKELGALAHDEVAAHIQLEVSRQLEELGERTREAVSAATQKVIAEFDRFGESLLGKETYWQTASGRAPRHRRGGARHSAQRGRRLMRQQKLLGSVSGSFLAIPS
jgi:hypothetical protein